MRKKGDRNLNDKTTVEVAANVLFTCYPEETVVLFANEKDHCLSLTGEISNVFRYFYEKRTLADAAKDMAQSRNMRQQDAKALVLRATKVLLQGRLLTLSSKTGE